MLFLFHFCFLCFFFIIVGSTVLFSLFIVNYIGSEFTTIEFSKDGTFVYSVSMIILAVIVGLFNLIAIFKNINFKKQD